MAKGTPLDGKNEFQHVQRANDSGWRSKKAEYRANDSGWRSKKQNIGQMIPDGGQKIRISGKQG